MFGSVGRYSWTGPSVIASTGTSIAGPVRTIFDYSVHQPTLTMSGSSSISGGADLSRGKRSRITSGHYKGEYPLFPIDSIFQLMF